MADTMITDDLPSPPIPLGRICVGMRASYSQTISDFEIKQFAGLSGDHNPIHLDEKYAEASRFKRRIAHGMISSSFFSALFGTKLPGPGCVYVSQKLVFKRPVYIGETVTAIIEVASVEIQKRIICFKTYCKVREKTVISGTAEIFVPKPKDIAESTTA